MGLLMGFGEGVGEAADLVSLGFKLVSIGGWIKWETFDAD